MSELFCNTRSVTSSNFILFCTVLYDFAEPAESPFIYCAKSQYICTGKDNNNIL